MSVPAGAELESLWSLHHATWRDPAQITAQWQDAAEVDPRLLRSRARGRWWETLAEVGVTLLVTREYEHLVMALRADASGPVVTYMRMPHPSGLAVDRERGLVHVASTRNPNQVIDLAPAERLLERSDIALAELPDRPLMPMRARFLPGCLYLHDLAFVGGRLHANAVGQNAVIRLDEDGRYERIWWPRCIETERGPVFGQNHLQLNSIAAGDTVATSFYSASTDRVSARRPGHANFQVDRRGVIFSGATREVVTRGLTRPHSARLHAGGIWVDNSGYGELVLARGDRFEPVVRLPGWTRGLCFHDRVAFVGTSRVIPRFRHYAPGLNPEGSVCGVHAVDTHTGQILGSLTWPFGNQVFAVDWAPCGMASGFPFAAGGRGATERGRRLFYAFVAEPRAGRNGSE